MRSVDTKYFGTLEYAEESVFDFPWGLPGFDDHKAFVLIETAESAPLVFLQSLAQAELCFLAFPIQLVAPNYQLAIAGEDLEALGLAADRQPGLGSEVVVLALISLHAQFLATANLMAPLVLNVKNRRGLQAIRRDFIYSHQHPVNPEAATQAASDAREGQPC